MQTHKKILSPCFKAACTFLICASSIALAQSETASTSSQSRVEVINAEVARSDAKFNRIDSENFEVTIAGGLMAIEDFDTGSVISGRLAYHLSERLFFEGSYTVTKGDLTSYEELRTDVSLIRDEDRDYTSWDISAGINLFPGETWIFGRAFSSDVYLIAGWGETEFGGSKWSTVNLGLGYRFFMTDWLAMRVDVRDHIFNRDIFGEDDSTNNFETTLGFSVFF